MGDVTCVESLGVSKSGEGCPESESRISWSMAAEVCLVKMSGGRRVGEILTSIWGVSGRKPALRSRAHICTFGRRAHSRVDRFRKAE
jgi:hypothetical protein